MRKAPAIAALSAFLLAIVPASAGAAIFDGKTSQGRAVRIFTSHGLMKSAIVNWTARCGSGTSYEGFTVFTSTSANTTKDGAVISRTYTGDRGRITAHLRGAAAGAGWRGTFRAKAGRCTVASVTFTAGAPGPAKSFVGTTGQNRVVTLTTGTNGIADRVRLTWRATCADGKSYAKATVFKNDTRTKARVHDRKGALVLDGKRTAGGWSGTVAGSVVIGKRRCTLKRLRWSADPT